MDKKKIRLRMRALYVATIAINIIGKPFWLIALPHIGLTRLYKRIALDMLRLEFVNRGWCGGCVKFGTKKCRLHCKNPQHDGGVERGCFADK